MRLFSEKPNAVMTKKVPINDTGIATIGMIAARQRLQEQDDDDGDQNNRLEQGLDHLVDRLLNELGGVVGDTIGSVPAGNSWRAPPSSRARLAAVASAFEPGR